MKLLHFADTHIGVESYGRIDPETGRHTRLLDFQRALERAVDIGLEAGVDAALFAGDAYRTCTPSPTHQAVFAQAMSRLLAAGIPLVMVAGNHDLPVAFGRSTSLDIFDMLGGRHVTVATRPALLRLETKAGPLQVAALPWPTRAMLLENEATMDLDEQQLRERLEIVCRRAIETMAGTLDAAVPGVLLAHVSATEATFAGSEKVALGEREATIPSAILADPRFDYVALGHIHRYQNLNRERRPAAVYPGSIERIDFSEQNDPKGVCLVTIGDGATPEQRTVAYEHVPLPARAFTTVQLDAGPQDDVTQRLVQAIERHEIKDAVVRVRYSCTDEQYQALRLSEVRTSLADAAVVAGIVRQKPDDERRPRVEVTEQFDVGDALQRYLDTRPELAGMRAEITAEADVLQRELAEAEAEAQAADIEE